MQLPKEKVLFLLSNTPYDSTLREHLANKGIKLLKFASQKTIIQNTSERTIKIYNQGSSRYGIDIVKIGYVDWCIGMEARKINLTAELIDINRNEVIAIINAGGWTDFCPLTYRRVFEEFADSLNSMWESNSIGY